jgi:hypothetical protein
LPESEIFQKILAAYPCYVGAWDVDYVVPVSSTD